MTLAEAFLPAILPERASAFGDRAEIEARLEALVEAARRAWPGVDVPAVAFAAHAGARAIDASSLEPTPGAVDLYLACACLRGSPIAIAEVERRAREQAGRAARRLRLSPGEADELSQQMTTGVLVGEHGTPGIAAYSGLGAVDAWLSATAFRMGVRMRDKAQRESREAEPDELADGWQKDPELDFVKRKYKDHFNEAFREALGSLTAREKSVLRLYVFGGMNIESIGACYRVHRATVARWIVMAREKLLAQTRLALARRLGLAESEVESMVGLLQSQVDVSLTSYLAASRE